MCTGGNDAARHGHVYVTLQNGTRIKLVAVNVYVYIGLPIQSNLKYTRLLSVLRKIANQRTWTTTQLAAKYKTAMHTTLIMWKSFAFNAFRHLLLFCRLDGATFKPLPKAQETWARALLGWNANLPGTAAVSDIGWLHITRELMMLRAAFYIRLKDLLAGPAYTRIPDILAAAERIHSSWSTKPCPCFKM